MIAAILAVALVTISTRQDIFESRYEKLSGTVRVGDVTSSLYVLQPRFAGESNGAALIEVADEAHRTLLRRFNRGGPNPDPETSADLGDGFLMKFGFTLVWVDQPAVVADLAASMRAPDAVVAAKHVYEWTTTPRVVRDFGSGKVFYIRTADDPATRAAGDTSRAYHFVGASADPGRLPPDNTVDYWWSMRALLLRFHRWVSGGAEPPQDGDVLLPEVAVPLATYTSSSATPFTRDEIRQRYPSHDDYLAKIRASADALIRRGLLLYDDEDKVVQHADDLWDVITRAR
ncbi:MAG TPA: alpha/beta hydrolase domain-containing protein [Vicinamibacterales bacterium]|nr:alpha/beta hydrolase domain-containing protein [Vicinamibacterales bacterium]